MAVLRSPSRVTGCHRRKLRFDAINKGCNRHFSVVCSLSSEKKVSIVFVLWCSMRRYVVSGLINEGVYAVHPAFAEAFLRRVALADFVDKLDSVVLDAEMKLHRVH